MFDCWVVLVYRRVAVCALLAPNPFSLICYVNVCVHCAHVWLDCRIYTDTGNDGAHQVTDSYVLDLFYFIVITEILRLKISSCETELRHILDHVETGRTVQYLFIFC